jgi:hypothetical protein
MMRDELDTLLVNLHGVCDNLEAVEVCLAEDAPEADALPVERRATAAVEHAAAAREARLCIDRARRGVSDAELCDLIGDAHMRLCDARSGFEGDIGGYAALSELERFCLRRGGDWPSWFATVSRTAAACPAALTDADRAFGRALVALASHQRPLVATGVRTAAHSSIPQGGRR